MYAPAPLRRQLNRSGLLLLGPAFVAAVAYVDPGNFATNIAAGATYGYLLCWVVVGANLMAVLVQYLAAKASIATGRTLPQLCRDHFKRSTSTGLWAQAELVAVATDLAEVVGGAIALNLLFGIPLLLGGVITGAVSFALLIYQSKRGQRPFEAAIIGLLAVVLVGFVVSTVKSDPSASGVVGGLVPRLDGTESLVLAAGMLGATVMPHAIWLHGALVTDRHWKSIRSDSGKSRVLRATRIDVAVAMALAGAVNLAMVVVAAAVTERHRRRLARRRPRRDRRPARSASGAVVRARPAGQRIRVLLGRDVRRFRHPGGVLAPAHPAGRSPPGDLGAGPGGSCDRHRPEPGAGGLPGGAELRHPLRTVAAGPIDRVPARHGQPCQPPGDYSRRMPGSHRRHGAQRRTDRFDRAGMT